MSNSKTIFLSGGHLAPAYAVGAYIKKYYPDVSVVFLARQKSFASSNTVSVESEVMKTISTSVAIPFERLSLSPASWISFINSYKSVRNLIQEKKPSVVVSFGGYVGFTIGLAALSQHIPLVIHEQTHTVGKANALLERFSTKFCVSYPELQQGKRIHTGFPLREEVIHPSSNLSFTLPENKPVVYITGGTTGAVTLNEVCFPLIHELTKTYTVVHQTGTISLDAAKRIQTTLPEIQRGSYIVTEYIAPGDAGWLMSHAAFVISRAGANTVYELAISKTPAVLLPLPVNTEQYKNAEWLNQYSHVEIIDQNSATSEILMKAIHKLKLPPIASEHSQTSIPQDGTERLVKEIISIL